jgi:transcriptional regulator with XRE-family HTH domain
MLPDFGEKVRPEDQFTLASLRKRLDLTLKEVADFMGIGYNQLVNIEKDSSGISVELWKKFAKLYSIPEEQIFLGNECTLSEALRKLGGYK